MTSIADSASEDVQELLSFQRKSAAIETIFTLAVLYIGVLQVIPVPSEQYLPALIPVSLLAILALLLGGRNLLNQLGEVLNL